MRSRVVHTSIPRATLVHDQRTADARLPDHGSGRSERIQRVKLVRDQRTAVAGPPDHGSGGSEMEFRTAGSVIRQERDEVQDRDAGHS
jgi:hypothetical protein